jgi:hypothetical protein
MSAHLGLEGSRAVGEEVGQVGQTWGQISWCFLAGSLLPPQPLSCRTTVMIDQFRGHQRSRVDWDGMR